MSNPSVEGGPSAAPALRNRRTSIRLVCDLAGVCYWEEGSCPVRVRNVSHSGLSLLFDQPAPLVTFVIVELCNASNTLSCSLKARLLYQVELPGGTHSVGASFPDRLDPVTLQALLS